MRVVHPLDILDPEPSSAPLIGERGVEEAVRDDDLALGGAVAEGRAQRELDHLLGRLLAVAAGLGPEGDATARVVRRPGRALTRAAGALLAVGLGATATDLAAGLGRVRALAGGSELRDDDLVDQRHVDLDAEDIGGQELSYAEVKAIASGNHAALNQADALALLIRPRMQGALVELGTALGAGKRVFLVGERTAITPMAITFLR